MAKGNGSQHQDNHQEGRTGGLGNNQVAQPVYENNGPFAYIKAFKNSVNFGFWRGIDLEDPENLLQGTGNKMRHVTLTGPADINRAPSRISFGKRRRSTSGRAIQPKADRPAKPAGK